MFLAAGRGERMTPYSTIMEKCMLPLGGKPIIRIIVDKIIASRICHPEDIIISVLEKNVPMFKHEFRDTGVNISGIAISPTTATHYLYASAVNHINMHEDVLVHYADNIADIDYLKLLNEYYDALSQDIFFMAAATKLIKHDYSLIQYESEMVQSLEWLRRNTDNRRFFNMATKFIEKPYITDPSWMGILFAKNHALRDEIAETKVDCNTNDVDFGFDVLPHLANRKKLAIYIYDGEWFDVGNTIAYHKLIKRYEAGEFKI